MAFVNYVRENLAFMEYAADNSLSASERLLWYALFHMMNQNANGSDWPVGFIAIPNKRLLSLVPYGEDSMIDARNRLKQRGRIEYIPGKKNKEAPKYKMIYFFPDATMSGYPHSYQQEMESMSKYSGNFSCKSSGNIGGNVGGNIGGNVGGKNSDINLNINRNPNRNPNVYMDDDEEDEEERAREAALRDMRSYAVQVFRKQVGRDALTAEVNRLALVTVNLDMSKELLAEALRMAAENGARNPTMYAIKLLDNWNAQFIRTLDDLSEYQFLEDMSSGRLNLIAPDDIWERKQEACSRRREESVYCADC